MEELKDILRKKGMDTPDVVMANEISMTGLSGHEIEERLDHILAVMESSLERGLAARGPLPGEIGLGRKAAGLAQRAREESYKPGRILVMFNAYALAVAEENAAGHVVVTAPTMGSCGVLPAVVRLAKEHFKADANSLRRGLMTAAVIGFLAKHNASISGAEVGCQGEIGVASAMAAAFLAQIRGASMDVLANAAEIALEHHLGMTCDPVKGYVQIPCVERNAMGAVKAYNAYLLASAGDPGKQKVSFDQVIQVMLDTGRDMSCKYKETSLGGLAVSMAQC
jgi:L-serine dehydratase